MLDLALLARVDAAVDERLGERIEIRPRLAARGVAAEQPDPARPSFVVTAVVIAEARTIDAGGTGRQFQTRISAGRVFASVRRAQLDGRDVRVDDRLVLVDRPGTPQHAITRVDDDDAGRVSLEIAR